MMQRRRQGNLKLDTLIAMLRLQARADGGHGWQDVPDPSLGVGPGGRPRLPVVELDDHLRRTRQHHLSAHLHGRFRDVGKHVTLYDASAVQVVPPATIALLQHTWSNPAVRSLWARKVAFVVSTMLARMQAQRLRDVREDIGIYDPREEAIAWLLQP